MSLRTLNVSTIAATITATRRKEFRSLSSRLSFTRTTTALPIRSRRSSSTNSPISLNSFTRQAVVSLIWIMNWYAISKGRTWPSVRPRTSFVLQSQGMKYRFVTTFILVLVSVNVFGQQRGEAPQPPQTPRATAPTDLTGYWVSIVTEDWRFRMVTPPKGDFASVPLNQEGIRVGNQWDPAKDEVAGGQWKYYGGPAGIGVPGRGRITGEEEN